LKQAQVRIKVRDLPHRHSKPQVHTLSLVEEGKALAYALLNEAHMHSKVRMHKEVRAHMHSKVHMQGKTSYMHKEVRARMHSKVHMQGKTSYMYKAVRVRMPSKVQLGLIMAIQLQLIARLKPKLRREAEPLQCKLPEMIY
jgi:hypothetical protein